MFNCKVGFTSADSNINQSSHGPSTDFSFFFKFLAIGLLSQRNQTMADVRALLKAKRQEARINHPYAIYSANGQLRCSVCGLAVKQASMWEGHLGSKSHRVNVTKAREAKALRVQKEEEERRKIEDSKRKAEADDEPVAKRRRLSDDEDDDEEPKLNGTKKQAFPADFFSDPSRAPRITNSDDEDEDEDNEEVAPSAQANVPKTDVDLEYERFQAALANTNGEDEEEEKLDAYNRATVAAEPEILHNTMDGIPQQTEGELIDELLPKGETEEEKQKRIEREERELIMDRLLEEERAQEEADSRVGLLKSKLEALKKAREAKRATKGT